MDERLRHFRFWCQKVLPLVYDDSISYYETLCKIAAHLNEIISSQNATLDELESIHQAIDQINEWIDNFEPSVVDEIINQHLAAMVYFGLTDAGYFVVYIPESWKSIQFATTGLDINIPCEQEYGHLVIKY